MPIFVHFAKVPIPAPILRCFGHFLRKTRVFLVFSKKSAIFVHFKKNAFRNSDVARAAIACTLCYALRAWPLALAHALCVPWPLACGTSRT